VVDTHRFDCESSQRVDRVPVGLALRFGFTRSDSMLISNQAPIRARARARAQHHMHLSIAHKGDLPVEIAYTTVSCFSLSCPFLAHKSFHHDIHYWNILHFGSMVGPSAAALPPALHDTCLSKLPHVLLNSATSPELFSNPKIKSYCSPRSSHF